MFLEDFRNLFFRRFGKNGLIEAGWEDVAPLDEIKEGVSDGVHVLHAACVESEIKNLHFKVLLLRK